jgi:hypothetical protein
VHLYTGVSSDFIADTTTNAITQRLVSNFEHHFRYRPPDNEVRSWQNSLSRFARVLELADLRDQGVIVEYQLPLTSKRLDVMVTGVDRASGDDSAVIVELKQWDAVTPSAVPDCVETWVGGGLRNVLHPSRQAADYQRYLLDTHTTFSDGAVGLRSCSYLHNLSRADAQVIFDAAFAALVSVNPAFVAEGTSDLATYLDSQIGGGEGGTVLDAVVTGRFRPHPRLMNHVAQVIENEPTFVLLDEQRVAANEIIAKVRTRQLADQPSVVVVRGGPGTGKSLIAVHVMAELARQGYTAVHATGSKAFTETLRKTVGNRAKDLFKYFNNFSKAEIGGIDLLVADEAHRIRESSNTRFTRKADRSDRPQIEELITSAKVSVFFIDDRQVVRSGETGSLALIRETADELGAVLSEHQLEAQFRCNGSDAFIRWVDNTLELERTNHVLWQADDPFTVSIADSPEELASGVRSRVEQGETARLVAGYCWPWSDPYPDGTLEADVVIGDWSMPWNAKPDSGRLAPGIPASHFWATDPGGLNQVGCVYTAQGFEFDHVGVIWGRDLVWRARNGWILQPEHNKDTAARRGLAKHPERFAVLVAQTYRVLLTRGMRSCTIFFEDPETENFIRSRIEGSRA